VFGFLQCSLRLREGDRSPAAQSGVRCPRQGAAHLSEDPGGCRRAGSARPIDTGGNVTLRHGARLHHIGVGQAHKGTRVILLVDGLDVRVVSQDGELLRHLKLNPSPDYQAQGS